MRIEWCILRCSGRNTIGLASSLRGGGIEAWTPCALVPRVITPQLFPRKVKPTQPENVPAPIMPTYVFARSMHVDDLLAISNLPARQHPDFSLFHHLDKIALVADRELDALRHLEERSRLNAIKRKPRTRTFSRGEQIRMESGPFAGMSGTVERDKGRFVMVTFDKLQVEVASFLIEPAQAA